MKTPCCDAIQMDSALGAPAVPIPLVRENSQKPLNGMGLAIP